MSNHNEHSPVDRYRQLARRIGVVRWVLPLLLFVVVCGVESSEHLLHDVRHDYFDFALEASLFGLIGPAIVAGVRPGLSRISSCWLRLTSK